MIRRTLTSALLGLAALVCLGAAPAIAAPVWSLDIHHNETNFAPGAEEAQYWLDVTNVGDTDSSGPVTLAIFLPGGVTRNFVEIDLQGGLEGLNWSCPGSSGESVVVCTTTDPIPRHTSIFNVLLNVSVHPQIEPGEVRFATATVSGGGAAQSASAGERTLISPAPAPFGVTEGSFLADFFESDRLTPEREAGGHPDNLHVSFDLNTLPAPDNTFGAPRKRPVAPLKNIRLDLPQGFVGDPTTVGECTAAQLTIGQCPRSSQVGRTDLIITKVTETAFTGFRTGLYNMVHPRGTITDLAFQFAGIPVHIKASLDPANSYAIGITVSDINETLPPFSSKVTTWGVPADESHDSERCGDGEIDTDEECPTDVERKPFLTLPSQCEEETSIRMHHYDSWEEPGNFGPDIVYDLPGKFTRCERPRFEPEVEAITTGKQANTPTGLDVHVKVPQNDSADALATPPVKRTTVTLPQGMSFSPSFADGLQSCTLAQMKLGTNEAVQCPDASRIGEVGLSSPLLPKSLEGSMYLAAQRDNPFASPFALLLVLHDTEERGVLVKVPGRIDVDETTGQIVTVFDDLPQFPFDDFVLKFRSGPRAPLISPPSCGKQTIGIEIASYARPQEPVDASNTYEVTEGPNGTPCPGNVSSRPFTPKFTAGTLNPVAGAYSPFLLRLTREDQEQELTGIRTKLPPGLVGKIAGVSTCPAAAIASISTAEFAGRAEQANPACPASSEIGSLTAGLGAGPGPNYFPGKVYLAGPYKGAKLSLAVVAPAIAGPFDLGNVVVRAALHVNPETAQITAVSDPFPTILHGVILRTRDVRLRVDRPDTTINPTNCAKMAIDGVVGGIGGAVFDTASPFQVLSCGDLSFKPKLDLRLFGGTKRGAHPKLRATLTMPSGGANIKSASVALPRSEFLDQGHIKTICTRVQFAAEACPAGSIYGTVEAKTPLLDETLTGNIYLRSSSHQLPDLVAAFRDGRIDANVVGRIDSVNGGIRNTFELVPDVPVSKATFTFQGGDKGLLVNSRNICAGTFRATAKFNAQSGAFKNWRPKMQARCGKAGKAKKRRR
jgi:hypothetical protein